MFTFGLFSKLHLVVHFCHGGEQDRLDAFCDISRGMGDYLLPGGKEKNRQAGIA